jgi:hypothetical protein
MSSFGDCVERLTSLYKEIHYFQVGLTTLGTFCCSTSKGHFR